MTSHAPTAEASFDNHQYDIWLWGILLLGIVLRVAWWFSFNHAIENEGAEYARLAENIVAGVGYHGMYGGPHVFFPPLYPILIAALSIIGIDFEFAARLISLAAGICTIALIAYLAHRLFGRRTGVLAAFLAACHPTMIALSVSTYSEGLYLCVAMSAVALALRSIDDASWKKAAVAGLVWGVAYLVRPEGLVFGVAFIGMAGLLIVLRTRRLVGGISVALAGTIALAIVSLPYLLNLSGKAGEFRWEGKSGINAIVSQRMRDGLPYGEAARGLDENGAAAGPMLRMEDETWMLQESGASASTLAAGLISHPLRAARSLLAKLYGAKYLASPWIFIVAAIGMFATAWWRRSLEVGVVVAMYGALTLALAVATDVRFSRYMFPVLPVAIIWASGGILWVGQSVSKLGTRGSQSSPRALSTAAPLVLAVGLCVIAFHPTAAVGEFSQANRDYVRLAGDRIESHFAEYSDRAARRPVIAGFGLAPAFYAGGVLRYLAYAPEDLAIEYLRGLSPDYVVLQNTEVNQAPYLNNWIENGIPLECAERLDVGSPHAAMAPAIQVWIWRCD